MDLWVGSEPQDPRQLWARQKSLMTRKGVTQALGPIHKSIILKGTDYFSSIRDQAYVAAKIRWRTSSQNVQSREPFNYRNFGLATDRFIAYGHLVLKEGPFWLGCRFRSPIVWYPALDYKAIYELPEGQAGHIIEELATHHGFRPFNDKPSPAYSLTALHVNYSFHEDMKKVEQGGMLAIERGMQFLCICSFFHHKHTSVCLEKVIYHDNCN